MNTEKNKLPPDDIGNRRSFVHVDCSPAQKGSYILASRRAGVGLVAWVLRVLDAAAKRENERHERGG